MKVVLVIDKPSNCLECPCCDARRDENGDYYIAECQADCDYDRDSWIDETTFAIPSWCPLRPFDDITSHISESSIFDILCDVKFGKINLDSASDSIIESVKEDIINGCSIKW